MTTVSKRVDGLWRMFLSRTKIHDAEKTEHVMRSKNKMLITGVSGLLGNNLAYYFRYKYDVLGLFLSHPVVIPGIRTEKCNMLTANSIEELIERFRPSVVVHCASLSDMDECERKRELAYDANVTATKRLVEAIDDNNVTLVYVSTDAVYDGRKGNFSEQDPVKPLNTYGQCKHDGEIEALKCETGVALRTNFFGWNIQNKKSLGEWVLEELTAGRQVHGFQDAIFSSVYTWQLARVMDIVIQKKLRGVYTCASSDSCSKFEFAIKIARQFGFNERLVVPISIDDHPFEATRGKDLSLDVEHIEKTLGYRMPPIDVSIDHFYRVYMCGLPDEIRNNNKLCTKAVSAVIPYGRQWIDENDVQSVVETLRSDRITQGPKVKEFESILAKYCMADHAVAVNSGTSALHTACVAAGVGPDDEVITSANTFVASANCAVYCGATPVFADIDSHTYNVSPGEIEKKISPYTKAVIPVHFAGQSCNMASIRQIVESAQKKYGHRIYIIEDACHALGSRYRETMVGSCTFSDMTVTSFHPVKHVTTGEGGAVLTNDRFLRKKVELIRSHGITDDPDILEDSLNQGSWYYEQIELGYNYRITDIQCALGISQFRKLSDMISRRREIVSTYNSAFKNEALLQIPHESPHCETNFHLYVLLLDFERMETSRIRFMKRLQEAGIRTQVHYIPVYTHPYFRKKYGTNWGDCPNAEEYYSKCLSIPLFPAMTDKDVEKVIEEIKLAIAV